MKKIEKYQYLVAFLQKQVREGITQKSIADYVGKSSTYINWLVLDKKKNKYVEEEIIAKIADFFEITPDTLLENGKEIFLRSSEKQEDNDVLHIYVHIHINWPDYA